MMGEFMKILFSLSVSGACLFLLVFSAVRLCRNRLSRRWQYYIWLLVVLRFLVPITFPNTLVGQLFQSVELAAAEGNTADRTTGEDAADSEGRKEDAADEAESTGRSEDAADEVEGEGIKDNAADGIENGERQAPEDTADSGQPGVSLWLFVIWAVGAAGFLIHKITAYRSYVRFLRSGNREVADLIMLNLLAEAEEKLGIRRAVELYRNPMIASPIMTGFFRPGIVIPDRKMTEKELRCIFEHELVHLQSFDMFYKWFVQITICIHWFNPFAWLLGKEVNRRCELACDEKVVGALDTRARKDYGDTLLSFLKREKNYQNSQASIMLTEGAEQMIERLGAIMDGRKKTKPVVMMTAALTVLLCFFFAGMGAYAEQPENGGISEADADLIRQAAVSIAVEEGILTEEEAGPGVNDKEIREITETAEEDRNAKELNGKQYTYYQRTNYEEPYIIEFGWNLTEEDEQYYVHKEILLEDQSRMSVCFAEEAEKWLEDAAAMEAVAKLLGETKQTAGSRFGLEMKQPFVVRIIYLPPEEAADFAMQAYENDNIVDFSAVTALLSEKEKEAYCERSYVEDDAAFFSVIISEMEADYVMAFVEKCYENDDITYFSIAIEELPEGAKKNLMRRALKENKENFYYMLKNS